MHLIGIKKMLVERYPWLATSVYKAFLEAQARVMIDHAGQLANSKQAYAIRNQERHPIQPRYCQ